MPDYTRYDEETLLVELAGGDENAFKKVFEFYKERFYSVALKMTRSDEVAKDIVQDVFMNIWKNRETLSNIQHPSSYFFTCVYRGVYQHYRKVALERKLLEGVLSEEKSINITDEMILARESKNLIDIAVDKLPPRQQLIFKLSKEEGFSREYVAEKLHLSPNTVKNHLAGAIKFIRIYLRNSAYALFIMLLFLDK